MSKSWAGKRSGPLPVAHCTSGIARITELGRRKAWWRAEWGSSAPAWPADFWLVCGTYVPQCQILGSCPRKVCQSAAFFTSAPDKTNRIGKTNRWIHYHSWGLRYSGNTALSLIQFFSADTDWITTICPVRLHEHDPDFGARRSESRARVYHWPPKTSGQSLIFFSVCVHICEMNGRDN